MWNNRWELTPIIPLSLYQLAGRHYIKRSDEGWYVTERQQFGVTL